MIQALILETALATLAAFAASHQALWQAIELVDPLQLSKGVSNGLHFDQQEHGFVIRGETDASSRYQLVSAPLELAPDTVALRLRLKGTIDRGGLYLGVVGQDGRFLQPVNSYSQGPVTDSGHNVLTRSNKTVTVVLGNIGPLQSSWRIDSLVAEQLDLASRLDMEFRPDFLGGLPPNLIKPVANSLKLVETQDGIALAGQTDSTQSYQVTSLPIPVHQAASLVRLNVQGKVVQGSIYYGLLDAQGRFLGKALFAGTGPITNSELLAVPGSTPAVTLVLGNAAQQPSEMSITKLRVEVLNDRERSAAIQRYAAAQGFEGSAWAWAWKALFRR